MNKKSRHTCRLIGSPAARSIAAAGPYWAGLEFVRSEAAAGRLKPGAAHVVYVADPAGVTTAYVCRVVNRHWAVTPAAPGTCFLPA